MSVSVEGLVAIERAKFSFDGIALLVGLNEAGKTTIAEAVASVMTQDPLMRRIKQKARLGTVVRTGQEGGKCAVEFSSSATAGAVMRWPGGEMETVGDFPPCSAEAVGRVKLTQLEPKERAQRLISILGTNITQADIAAELPDQAGEIAKRLMIDGWDGALAYYEKERTRLKGQWEGATGDRYGSAKAVDWKPAGWESDLADADEVGLLNAAAAAKVELLSLKARSAFNAGERAAHAKDAARYDEFVSHVAKLEAELKTAGESHQRIAAKVAALPPLPGKDHAVLCPLCKGRLKVDRRPGVMEITAAPPLPDATMTSAELAELGDRHARGAGALANAKDMMMLKEGEIAQAKRYRDVAKAAKERLAEMEGEEGQAPAPEIIDRATAAVARADSRVAAFVARANAEAKQAAVVVADRIVRLLAPDGLRKKKLTQAIESFNTDLQQVSLSAGLNPNAPVWLTSELDVNLGQRSYGLLSAGAQYVVDAAIQVAIARRQKAPIMVFDGSEVVVGKRMSGLLAMIKMSEIPAIVCRAAPARDKVPDLGKSGVGITLWVENGGVS